MRWQMQSVMSSSVLYFQQIKLHFGPYSCETKTLSWSASELELLAADLGSLTAVCCLGGTGCRNHLVSLFFCLGHFKVLLLIFKAFNFLRLGYLRTCLSAMPKLLCSSGSLKLAEL